MGTPEVTIRIIANDNCPLYEINDEFTLSGKDLIVPQGKSTCIILAHDITNASIRFDSIVTDCEKYVFDCSGCTGLVRLEYEAVRSGYSPEAEQARNIQLNYFVTILSQCSCFKSLDQKNIQDVATLLKLSKFEPGEIILQKGQSGKHLYLIASGKVEILNEDVHIAFLEKGEIFGEMSLLSGDPVSATVKAIEPVTVLYLEGRAFKDLLRQFPSLHMDLASMLSKRLAKTNVNVRIIEKIDSGITGNLAEMPPADLLQAFNVTQKTGVLKLEVSRGPAEIFFRDGSIIGAKYAEELASEAIFEIIKEKQGTFRFSPGLVRELMDFPEIGEFMWLLMEGLRRADEAANT
jgi:CRP-like cAMP-binding protein